jgi:hypothetical protein
LILRTGEFGDLAQDSFNPATGTFSGVRTVGNAIS